MQNLAFTDGNSTGETTEGGGGGAIFVRGGRFKVVNSRFVRNRCDATGPDLGGAAVRVLSQYQGLPVYVVNSTFGGGAGAGRTPAPTAAALSSIGVSWAVLNSVFTHNDAIGSGANPARRRHAGRRQRRGDLPRRQPVHARIAGSDRSSDNHANEGGGAIFFVSNDRTGPSDHR